MSAGSSGIRARRSKSLTGIGATETTVVGIDRRSKSSFTRARYHRRATMRVVAPIPDRILMPRTGGWGVGTGFFVDLREEALRRLLEYDGARAGNGYSRRRWRRRCAQVVGQRVPPQIAIPAKDLAAGGAMIRLNVRVRE